MRRFTHHGRSFFSDLRATMDGLPLGLMQCLLYVHNDSEVSFAD